MLIGLGEALITALVLAAIARARPELLSEGDGGDAPLRYGALALQGVLASLGLALFVAPFACGWPDGLERVARRLHVTAHAAALRAQLPDYRLPGIGPAAAATAAAAAAGTLMAFALAWLVAVLLTPRRRPRGAREEGGGSPRASRPD